MGMGDWINLYHEDYYKPNGRREKARRLRQISSGQLKWQNGLRYE